MIIILCILCIYKFFPFGTMEYDDLENIDNLDVPKYSNSVEVSGNQIIITSLRSAFVLEHEMNGIIDKYEKYKCEGETVYYSSESDLTIDGYTIDSWGLLNRITIVFKTGYKIPNECVK